MARGVHQIDHVGLALVALGRVLELQGRGGHGNAAFLLHLHPVGDRGLAVALAVHRAGLVDDVRVKCQRLRQRGLTSIRVGDDGECAAAGSFGGNTHAG